MRVFLVMACLLFGCSGHGNSPVRTVDMTPEQVRSSQRERTASFEYLVGRGVIEFRWTDDDGNHKEQGDLDFWKRGSFISLRISKLGDVLMWFGGEHQSYWLFDMLGDETTLTLGGDTALFSDIDVALVLLGLAPLPEGDLYVRDGVVTLSDEIGRAWTATFDPSTYRPIELHVVGNGGTSSAMHRRGIRVEQAGKHELYWPLTGGLVDLEHDEGDTKVKIVFSTLSTIVEDEPLDRVCNFAYLQKALKPKIIIQDTQE